MEPVSTAFALAAVLHAGFQVTVTVLVYPVLVRVGLEHPDEWRRAHERHSRSIVSLVGLAYVALLVTGLWSLLSSPGPLDLVALIGAWGAVLVTGIAAAPTHGRLVTPDPRMLRRLLVSDRWRCAAAVLGAVASVAALL